MFFNYVLSETEESREDENPERYPDVEVKLTDARNLNPPETSEEGGGPNNIAKIKLESSPVSIEDLVMDELTGGGAMTQYTCI